MPSPACASCWARRTLECTPATRSSPAECLWLLAMFTFGCVFGGVPIENVLTIECVACIYFVSTTGAYRADDAPVFEYCDCSIAQVTKDTKGDYAVKARIALANSACVPARPEARRLCALIERPPHSDSSGEVRCSKRGSARTVGSSLSSISASTTRWSS